MIPLTVGTDSGILSVIAIAKDSVETSTSETVNLTTKGGIGPKLVYHLPEILMTTLGLQRYSILR